MNGDIESWGGYRYVWGTGVTVSYQVVESDWNGVLMVLVGCMLGHVLVGISGAGNRIAIETNETVVVEVFAVLTDKFLKYVVWLLDLVYESKILLWVDMVAWFVLNAGKFGSKAVIGYYFLWIVIFVWFWMMIVWWKRFKRVLMG